MNHIVKRVLAYTLLLCMLLSALPMGVSAAQVTYTWNAAGADSAFAKACTTLLPGSDRVTQIVSGYITSDASGKQTDTYYQIAVDKAQETTLSYFGMQFNTVAAGNYTVTIKVEGTSGDNEYTIHAFPSAFFSDCVNTTTTNEKAAQAIDAGTHKIATAKVAKNSASTISFTAELGEAPVIVLVGPQYGGKKFFRFTEISISGESTGAAPTTPAGPSATVPSTQPATTPETADPTTGSDVPSEEVSLLVDVEIVADDIVSQSYFTHAAAGVINGHDYLYLATRGGKFVVYDIDDKKQIHASYTGNDLPRYVMVDENGYVWVTAANSFLRYDPFNNTSEIVSIDAGVFGDKGVVGVLGMVSDGNGKLYFGTLNHGYIGCYDTATKQTYKISDWLGIPGHEKDTKEAGYGGLLYHNGYLYLGIDGDMNEDGNAVHAIIKYDIANKKVADYLDLSQYVTSRKYFDNIRLIDNILFCSFIGGGGIPPIDISGSKMKITQLQDISSVGGAVTEGLDGKHYATGYYGPNNTKCVIEYDSATKTSKVMAGDIGVFRVRGNSLVTVEGDDRLPGYSVVSPINDEAAGVINLSFFNPQTKEQVIYEANIGLTGGAGSNLRGIVTDPTGRYVYVGAFANPGIAKYDTVEGKVVDIIKSYSYQTDALYYYNGYLYAGNYSAGSITQINTDTHEIVPLFTLRYSVFEQCRMHSLTAGDNKVFCGPTPYSGMGGVLVWYDYDKQLTYVAGGPNPEDVYYADTAGLIGVTNLQNLKYTWYNAVTGEVADFDDDDDGKDDVYLADGTRRFRGPIADQVLNNLVYKDGYIYGTSSTAGASGTFPEATARAKMFVYDVTAMKVIATCDLGDYLEGFDNELPYIDQLFEDPEEPGKFWGVVANTLFTMTFDLESKSFTIKEEFTLVDEQPYFSLPGGALGHRDICFDGEYMYIGFGRHYGTYMIRKNDTSERYLINEFSPNHMVLAADGNLYWTSNETSKSPKSLSTFRIAEKAAPLLAKAPVDTAQKLINALPDKITKDDKAAIDAARKAYDKLTDEQKAQITGLDKLIAAEEAFAKLPSFNMTIVYVAIAAVVVLGGGAAAVVIVLKKKKKAE